MSSSLKLVNVRFQPLKILKIKSILLARLPSSSLHDDKINKLLGAAFHGFVLDVMQAIQIPIHN
jgi:hypothetical protein